MDKNTDIFHMEKLVRDIKLALKEPFVYHDTSSKLQELLNVIENMPQEVILDYMGDLMFISNVITELNQIVDGFVNITIDGLKSKSFSLRA